MLNFSKTKASLKNLVTFFHQKFQFFKINQKVLNEENL